MGSSERAPDTLGLLNGSAADRATRANLETSIAGPPAGEHVVAVDFELSPDERVERWRQAGEHGPRAATVLSVGEGRRGAAGATTAPITTDRGYEVRPVPEGDVDALAAALRESLAAASQQPGPIRLTVDSVSRLLDDGDADRGLALVESVGRWFRMLEGSAYFHLDPEQVGAPLVDAFTGLVDRIHRPGHGPAGDVMTGDDGDGWRFEGVDETVRGLLENLDGGLQWVGSAGNGDRPGFPVSVERDDDRLRIHADLPDVRAGDVALRTVGGELVIEVYRPDGRRTERVSIPEGAAIDPSRARVNNGVLTVAVEGGDGRRR